MPQGSEPPGRTSGPVELDSEANTRKKSHLFRVKSSKQCTKRSLVKFTEAFLTRFSLTIPSLAAKKAKTWEMKCFSSGFRGSQCAKSLDKSTLE